ncbi:hypothetical protein WICMUC_002820 [Wickerhamomyces mucosus]|uniref:Signal peptidase complex subunit 2 n=1 Tax=Wickerhamomyces mucosus TaxID=1378264 RepID=A0A9P8PPW3_9ASCO|nr:hypothetical protein WICMUC_002820 [Wickerhamomyces mucosus]
MSQFQTANINSVVDLRTATDAKIGPSLTKLGFSQSFSLIDTRLGLGYLSAIIAALTFYIEKKFSFQDGFNYTFGLVILYFIVVFFQLLHSKYFEKNIIYKGSNSNDKIVIIRGKIDKYIPQYDLKFDIKDGKNNNKRKSFDKVLQFVEIFDKFGNLHEDKLIQWLKLSLEEKEN